jgi:RNA-dependent RNA polymerase
LGPVDQGKDALSEMRIMDSVGDFTKETNVLKRYARRGQCFSTAKYIMTLDRSQVEYDYPDIKRNGFTFTDGVGHIS